MSKYLQDVFIPTNPGKYVGHRIPYYRSSWELAFMRFCDLHKDIVKWASEPIRIPYKNPLNGQMTTYVPDFMIEYIDKTGKMHVELIEIKPANQSLISEAKSKKNKIELIINAQKWKAAAAFCQKQGIKFRIINESSLFTNNKKKK